MRTTSGPERLVVSNSGAASLAGAEQRLGEVRAERDELMTQLEQATEPVREGEVAELDV